MSNRYTKYIGLHAVHTEEKATLLVIKTFDNACKVHEAISFLLKLCISTKCDQVKCFVIISSNLIKKHYILAHTARCCVSAMDGTIAAYYCCFFVKVNLFP